jgi:hypothetical protein
MLNLSAADDARTSPLLARARKIMHIMLDARPSVMGPKGVVQTTLERLFVGNV